MDQDVDLCQAFYLAVKRQSFCLICRSPEVQFHHVFPEHKIAEVCKVAKLGNMNLLIDEFNKVVPLCEPDHRAVHRGRIKGWLFGRTVHGAPSHANEAVKHMPFLERIEMPERDLQ